MKTLEEIRDEVEKVKPKIVSLLEDNEVVSVTKLRVSIDELDEIIDRALLTLIEEGRVDMTKDWKICLVQ